MPLKHRAYEVITGSGVKGLVIDIPDATVASTALFFNAGYYLVPSGAAVQTAHVIEHILMGSTTDTRYASRNAVVQEARKNGAWTNAFTYTTGNWYISDTIADDTKRIMELQWLVLNNPRLDEKILKSEIGNVQEEMRRNVGNNERLALEITFKALGTGLATSKEFIDEAETVTLEKISRHYESNYTMSNLTFIVAGDYKKYLADALKLLDTSSLPEGVLRQAPVPAIIHGGVMSYVRSNSLSSIYMNLTFGLKRRLTMSERTTVKVLNNMLFTQSSVGVIGTARERGICYGMSAYTSMQFPGYSLWSVAAPIGPGNAAALIELIIDAFKTIIVSGIASDEFEAAKAYTLGSIKRNGQTPLELTNMYWDDYIFDNRISDLTDFGYFQDITADSARALVKEFMTSNVWSLAGVGPKDESTFATHYDQFAKFLNTR